jgi:hypothetical protein
LADATNTARNELKVIISVEKLTLINQLITDWLLIYSIYNLTEPLDGVHCETLRKLTTYSGKIAYVIRNSTEPCLLSGK